MELITLIIPISFFILGILGIFLPVLPGAPLIFIGMLLYGVFTGFESLSLYFFIIQGAAVILAMVTDYFATAFSTKKYGGTKLGSIGAIVGTILGAIIFPPLGLFIGSFIGAMIGELISGKSAEQALKTGLGALIGFLGSALIKLVISISMIIWFFTRIF